MDIQTLYPLVTEAIRRAEVLDDLHAPGARDAWRDVSRLEERIAGLLPATGTQGVIARRGAVSAAISGGEFQRAVELADRYILEDGRGTPLSDGLKALRAQAVAGHIKALPGEGGRAARLQFLDTRLSSGHEVAQAVRDQFEGLAAHAPESAATIWNPGDSQEVPVLLRNLMNVIAQELKRSGKLTVPDFGTFTVRDSRRREGSLHGDGEGDDRKTVRFQASPALRTAI